MDHLLTLLLGPGGLTVLVLIELYAGWKKWWVFGWYARRVEAEAEEWKAIALKGATLAERVATVAEKSHDGPS